MIEELLSSKELAVRLKRSYGYVKAMKRNGFRMVAGRTTITAAITWLAKNPKPTAKR
jgi:DNA-binding CsgD family transcriptional regulator